MKSRGQFQQLEYQHILILYVETLPMNIPMFGENTYAENQVRKTEVIKVGLVL